MCTHAIDYVVANVACGCTSWGRLGHFQTTTAMSMSLTGSRFSSDFLVKRPFHHGS